MKKIIVLLVLASALTSVADEQGILTGTNTLTLVEGESLIVLGIIGIPNFNFFGPLIDLEFPPYGVTNYQHGVGGDSPVVQRTILGPCKVKPGHSDYRFWYRITTADVFASPMNVVSLPGDNNGDVDLVIESSPDLETWTPVYSGSAGTSGTEAFFRTRLIQN